MNFSQIIAQNALKALNAMRSKLSEKVEATEATEQKREAIERAARITELSEQQQKLLGEIQRLRDRILALPNEKIRLECLVECLSFQVKELREMAKKEQEL